MDGLSIHTTSMHPSVDPAITSHLCTKLTYTLSKAVRRNLSDVILLSGGLDTSIIATLAADFIHLHGVTLAMKNTKNPDLPYAKLVARNLGIHLVVKRFGISRVNDALRTVIRILRTFDPMEVRNSVAIQIGLETVQELGFKEVMTGDGGDELFAGYSFFFDMTEEELEVALQKIWSSMRFSAFELADALGISVRAPFLDDEVKELARQIPVCLKVRQEGGTVYGKWILRRSFAHRIPREVVWRTKIPIEVGTGTTFLPNLYATGITPEIFQAEKEAVLARDGVNIRDPEHLTYYKIFRKYFGPPKRASEAERVCTSCGSVVKFGNFCRTCGEYPAVKECCPSQLGDD